MHIAFDQLSDAEVREDGMAFLIELTFLEGGPKLAPVPIVSLVRY